MNYLPNYCRHKRVKSQGTGLSGIWVSGGWMVMFRKKKIPECLDNNEEAEHYEVDCFLCQEKLIVKSCEYSKHLEKQHGVIFCVKEIMKTGEKYQSIRHDEVPDHEAEPKVIRTDADTVKELVEMKFLSKRRKIRLRTPRERLLSRKYKVLFNEQQELPTKS